MNKNIHNWEVVSVRRGAPNWAHFKPYLATCVKYGQPGKILDIGCGIGAFVECYVRFGVDCTGLEGDPWAVDTARKRYDMNIRRHLLDKPLPFDDGSVSIVHCKQVIEHIPGDKVAFLLSKCHRILNQNGILVFNFHYYYNLPQRKDQYYIQKTLHG